MSRLMQVLILTASSALVLSASEPNQEISEKKLAAMAISAKTEAEHSAVARQYDSRADAFEAKAKRHDAEADKLANQKVYNPMMHKWPALAQAPAEKQRRLAMEARRAAQEARDLAGKHRESLETLSTN